MKTIHLLILSLLVIPHAFASEIDSYHNRFLKLKDATDSINQFSNKLFDSLLEKTNKEDDYCNEESLYKNLRREFHNHFYGKFNKYISKSTDLERVKIKAIDSIYGDFKTRDSLILGYYSQYVVDTLATALNIRGHFIGSDKFEHFAGSGYKYFENYYLKKRSIESTLAIGKGDETGILGAYTTGVMSYGDMSAEFNGMRFWNSVLAKNPDILGENLGPYVKCENNRWVKVNPLDIGRYVDESWDEGINCSKFRTKEMLNKVKGSIKKLEAETGRNFTCPIEAPSLAPKKYGAFSKELLNTRWDVL